ncbi:hypothetical protein NKH18_47585 [Streptomyces sp. M10(2022)]
MAVSGLPGEPNTVELTEEALERFGVGPSMPGRAIPRDLPGLTALVPAAIDEAKRHLGTLEEHYRLRIEKTLAPTVSASPTGNRMLSPSVRARTSRESAVPRVTGCAWSSPWKRRASRCCGCSPS